MDSVRKARKARITPATQRACLECQKRKTRCIIDSGESTECIYCQKTGKRCVFEEPPDRTSLTRKNLDAAEWRIKQLESLIHSMDPRVDIEDAINGMKQTSEQRSITRSSTASDEFEWHEGTPGITGMSKSDEALDGMAILPAKAQEAGYLGKSELMKTCRIDFGTRDNSSQEAVLRQVCFRQSPIYHIKERLHGFPRTLRESQKKAKAVFKRLRPLPIFSCTKSLLPPQPPVGL